MPAPKPIEVKPGLGGQLMSDLSADNVGLFNYTRKSEWRRFLDREIRSEGYDKFNPSSLSGYIPMPNTAEPITLNCECLAQNGRKVVVVGTRTTLWRYVGSENGMYYSDDFAAEDYGETATQAWSVIGSGFSNLGKRWEAVALAGLLVLNNGADLPVSYKLGAGAVEPLWELREQGIASVDTIWKFNDILMCGGIRQINADKHREIMSTIPSAINVGVAGAEFLRDANGNVLLGTISDGGDGAGNTLHLSGIPNLLPFYLNGRKYRMANGIEVEATAVDNAGNITIGGNPLLVDVPQPVSLLPESPAHTDHQSETMFPGVNPNTLIGLRLFWNDGSVRLITGCDQTSGCLLLDSDMPISSGPVSVENASAYAVFSDEANLDHFRWRTIWSMPGEPRRFAAVIPGTSVSGSQQFVLDYPVRSLESGQEITVTDAGLNGEPLRTTILFAYPGIARSLMLVDQAENDSNACLATRTDAVGSIVGYDDLIGDGSGILRGTTLRGYVVIAKETSFFVGRYTGSSGAAFSFEQLLCPLESALSHKGAFINVGDEYVLYAGASSFYRLDLTNRKPMEVGVFKPCQQLFFDSIKKQDQGEPLPYTTTDNTQTNHGITQIRRSAKWSGLTPDAPYDLTINGKVQRVYPGKYMDVDGNILPTSEWAMMIYHSSNENILLDIKDFSLRRSDDSEDNIFAVENPLTKEIWIAFPSSSDQNVLRFDTDMQTVSTSGLPIASACAVTKPENTTEIKVGVRWFIMGGKDGSVLRYGLTSEQPKPSGAITATGSGNEITASADFFSPNMVGKSLLFDNKKCVAITGYISSKKVQVLGSVTGITNKKFTVLPAIWHRDGYGYQSIMESGLESFGQPDSEKSWTQYVPILASKQSSEVSLEVALRGANNPNQPEDVFVTEVSRPLTENLVTLILSSHYIGDRITVDGINNPCELAARTFLVGGVDSRSFQRRKA